MRVRSGRDGAAHDRGGAGQRRAAPAGPGPVPVKGAPVESGRVITIVRPPPGVASAARLSAHGLRESLRHGKAEPDAGGLGGVVEALERAEHVQDPFRRDTPAVVDDAQLARGAPAESRRAEPAGGPHHHDVRIRGVFDGVFDDVRDHALQHALVGIDLGHVGWKLHPHPARRDAVQCAGDDLVPAQRDGAGG